MWVFHIPGDVITELFLFWNVSAFFSIKHFKIFVLSCCERQKRLKSLKVLQNGKTISTLALLLHVPTEGDTHLQGGPQQTTLSVVTDKRHCSGPFTFILSQQFSSCFSLQVRQQFHHILLVRANVA